MKGEESRREFLFQPRGHLLEPMRLQETAKMTLAPQPRIGQVCSPFHSLHDHFCILHAFPHFLLPGITSEHMENIETLP